MAEHAKPPEELRFKGDVASNWKLWKQKFNLYLLASGKSEKKDDVKIAVLLSLLGDEGIQIYNTFEYSEGEDNTKLTTILAKFDTYCNPIRNLVYEHFKFFKRDQLPGETVDQFVTALRQLANTCDFKEKDVLIRDRIVLGIRDLKIQERLLQNQDLKLTEAISICRSMESSAATQKEISRESSAVNVVSYNSSRKPRNSSGDFSCRREMSKQYQRNASGVSDVKPSGRNSGKNCTKCGLDHPADKCPAFNRYCSRCKRKGHYRKFCKTSNVHAVERDYDSADSDSSENSQIVWTVVNTDTCAVEWFENISIEDGDVKLKIVSIFSLTVRLIF